MKLLAHLPPPALPVPFSWEEWKKNSAGKYTVCTECEDHYTQTCGECAGDGSVECCECGKDKECDVCDGEGQLSCQECNGEYRYDNYVRAIAADYRRYLEFRKIVVSKHEVYSIALRNSFSEKRIKRGAA